MRKRSIAALALLGLAACLALKSSASTTAAVHPIWREVKWGYPVDQWGSGRAFRCNAADCGTDVDVFLRAKIGFCNCTTGVADDDDVDRMGDTVLLGEVSPLGSGRPISVAWMKGRSRAYKLNSRDPSGKAVLSVVYNERCDMIAATAVLGHDRPETIERSVIEFLNSSTAMRWAEITLGL
jgi:hypothetical protein